MRLRPFIVAIAASIATTVAAQPHDKRVAGSDMRPDGDMTTSVAPPVGRPRIGLVLGGGGARGAAHIGVLQELERMRIPIDVIVGTSMGAVVGGLYASGMSADDLETLVNDLDWKDALSDNGRRDALSFRRKQDDEDFPIRFEVGLKGSEFQLPQGLLQGQRLDLVLRRLTIGSSYINDFDDLEIPFRAVASDLETGEHYVMGEGDLALALRASMSVPGAFAPVIVDDRLLVDGGLVGNLAVAAMQEIGVDIIIAVDVEFPLYKRDQLLSAVGISEQVLTILIRKETLRQIDMLDDDDILIQPELGEFPSTNFLDSAETIEPGLDATRARRSQLQQYSLSEADYEQYLASRTLQPRTSGTIDFVRVENDSPVSSTLLERYIQTRPGDQFDAETLAEDTSRLYGLQVFEKVGYQLVEDGDELGVVFNATSKNWGPSFLRFGLSIEDDFEGSTSFNIATRLWRPAINSLGAEWRTDLRLGTDPLFASEFYQPLRADSRVFFAPSILLEQRNFNVFQDDEAIAQLRLSDATIALDLGAELGTIGEFRVGLFRGISDARIKVGDPALPDPDFDTGGVQTSLRIDTRDNARFPRSGTQADVLWRLSRQDLGADRRYEIAEFDIDTAWSRGKSTLVLGLQFGSSLDTESTLQDHFALGGFLRLSGLERGQLVGPYAGLARLVYYRRVGNSAGGLIEVPVYLGASLEAGNAWSNSDDIGLDSLVTNGSVFLGLDTYFGPVYLAAGLAEGGHTNFYLFVGAAPR